MALDPSLPCLNLSGLSPRTPIDRPPLPVPQRPAFPARSSNFFWLPSSRPGLTKGPESPPRCFSGRELPFGQTLLHDQPTALASTAPDVEAFLYQWQSLTAFLDGFQLGKKTFKICKSETPTGYEGSSTNKCLSWYFIMSVNKKLLEPEPQPG